MCWSYCCVFTNLGRRVYATLKRLYLCLVLIIAFFADNDCLNVVTACNVMLEDCV